MAKHKVRYAMLILTALTVFIVALGGLLYGAVGAQNITGKTIMDIHITNQGMTVNVPFGDKPSVAQTTG